MAATLSASAPAHRAPTATNTRVTNRTSPTTSETVARFSATHRRAGSTSVPRDGMDFSVSSGKVPPEFEGTPKDPPPAPAKRPKNHRNLLRRVIRRESMRRSP
jgi:hypothetical protein